MDDLTQIYQISLATFDGKYGHLAEMGSIIIFVLVLNFFVKWLLIKLHLRFEKQKKIWKDSFVQALYLPLSCFVWFFAAIHILNMIGEQLISRSLIPKMNILMEAIFAISFAWFFMRWKRKIVTCMIVKQRRHEISIEAGKIDVIDKLVTMLILFGTGLALLEITGRSMNTLIAFGGIGGLAIAFASQEVIANFFGGLMIYLTHPFTIGDWINLPERNIEGHVEEIGWYMTLIRTFEKRPIYIPNSTFSKVVVMTPSRMSHRQFKETVGVRYSDMPRVKKIIQDLRIMVANHPKVDHHLNNLVYLTAFGNYSVDILVSAYFTTISTKDYAEVKEDLLFKIYEVISKNGADFAYPTTQVELAYDLKAPVENTK